ncbi:hypothetical protein [Burkholderia multivorans]|uniref:hypothetical protein n=1 Tax=Burkholderia multivorans TaxID=87883 RepID=UPI002ED3556F|nr:hypothetical protein V1241_27420 [Burkholderia multivorans]
MSIYAAAPFWGDEYAVNASQPGEGLRGWWTLLRRKGAEQEQANREERIAETAAYADFETCDVRQASAE